MARRPKKIETVLHGTFEAPIYFEAESGAFSCQYGGDEKRSQVLPEVRKWAKERLRALCELRWDPILMVQFSNEDSRVNNLVNCAQLEVHIERYHISWDGKQWVQCPWVVMPPNTVMCSGPNASDMLQENYPMSPGELATQRIARSKPFYDAEKVGQVIKFPIISSSINSAIYYVPYTEERWLTMIGIIDKLRELRGRIHTMLSSADGWNQLATIAGVKLLMAPDEPGKA